jgi:hypothetical protein
MSEYEEADYYADYSDDELLPDKSRRPRTLSVLAGVILLLAGSLFLKTTLAANISLNSSGVVQFGQGQTATTACSGSNNLTVTPQTSFANASGGGTQNFSSVTVSGVPVACYGKDLIINAYNSSSNPPLALFASTATDIVVLDNNGSFVISSTVTGLSIVTNSTTSFTVTFTAPVASSASVYKLTVQSVENTILFCSNGGTCSQGDKGPGGGTIVFAVFAGFPCGANMASTCHYIEMAPHTWSGLSQDPSITPWSPNNNSVAGTSPNVGAGYANNALIYAAYGSAACIVGSTCTYAIQAAVNYSNGGYKDWFIPSTYELRVMCNYANGNSETSTNTDVAQTCTSRSGANASGVDSFVSNAVYWSSTQSTTNTIYAYDQYLITTTGTGSDVKNNSNNSAQWNFVRPIREF